MPSAHLRRVARTPAHRERAALLWYPFRQPDQPGGRHPMAQTDSETLSLIEGLLKEQRTFPPSEEFRRSAIIQDDAVYREAEEDFEGFWARLADEFIEWYRKPEKRLEWDSAALHLVRGRRAERRVQLPRQTRGGGPGRPCRLPRGRRAGLETPAISPTPTCWPRCAGSRTGCGSSESARAIASASTWGWCPSCRSRCSRARGSARPTSSSSAASRRTRSPSGFATPARGS